MNPPAPEPTDNRSEATCDEVEALLPLVADGSLDETSDPALFAHLARCCACQDSLARHDLVELALEKGFAAEVPTAGKSRLIRFTPAFASACAASLALAMAGGWYAEHRHGEAAAFHPHIATLPTPDLAQVATAQDATGQVDAVPAVTLAAGRPTLAADQGVLIGEPEFVSYSPDAPASAMPDRDPPAARRSPDLARVVSFDPFATLASATILPRHFIIIHTDRCLDGVLIAPDGVDARRQPVRMTMPVDYQHY